MSSLEFKFTMFKCTLERPVVMASMSGRAVMESAVASGRLSVVVLDDFGHAGV